MINDKLQICLRNESLNEFNVCIQWWQSDTFIPLIFYQDRGELKCCCEVLENSSISWQQGFMSKWCNWFTLLHWKILQWEWCNSFLQDVHCSQNWFHGFWIRWRSRCYWVRNHSDYMRDSPSLLGWCRPYLHVCALSFLVDRCRIYSLLSGVMER